ncbi:MAG: hypothetical protein IPM29_32880 [Planctomycetes bacterium]|nr:hypothetical protein [Planctomycetota bacterium]
MLAAQEVDHLGGERPRRNGALLGLESGNAMSGVRGEPALQRSLGDLAERAIEAGVQAAGCSADDIRSLLAAGDPGQDLGHDHEAEQRFARRWGGVGHVARHGRNRVRRGAGPEVVEDATSDRTSPTRRRSTAPERRALDDLPPRIPAPRSPQRRIR